jgi:hypothetical protein
MSDPLLLVILVLAAAATFATRGVERIVRDVQADERDRRPDLHR